MTHSFGISAEQLAIRVTTRLTGKPVKKLTLWGHDASIDSIHRLYQTTTSRSAFNNHSFEFGPILTATQNLVWCFFDEKPLSGKNLEKTVPVCKTLTHDCQLFLTFS